MAAAAAAADRWSLPKFASLVGSLGCNEAATAAAVADVSRRCLCVLYFNLIYQQKVLAIGDAKDWRAHCTEFA